MKGITALAVCLALGAGVAYAKAVEVARAAQSTGKVTVRSGGDVKPVGKKTEFKEGDVLVVEAGGRTTIEFKDESSIALVGPAQLQFVQIGDKGRKVKLESGVITQAYTRGVALGIQTPYDSEFVLQNATGFARVVPGDKVTFQKVDGDDDSFAKVYRGGQYSDVGKVWTLDVRGAGAVPGVAPAGSGDTSGMSEAAAARADNVGTLQFASSEVQFLPKSEFKRDDLPQGGARLTYEGEDFGRIQIGDQSVLFLGPGEFIVFDGRGQVVEFTGVVHVYHPINDPFSFFTNPVRGVEEASASRPRRR